MPESVPSRVTLAWFASYLISIWLQHFLHNSLVYGWSVRWREGRFLLLLVSILAVFVGRVLLTEPI